MFGARIDIAADVTAGNSDVAHQRGHDVREILAHAFASFDRVVDRRIDVGGFGHVIEPIVDRCRSIRSRKVSGSSRRCDLQARRSGPSRAARGLRELAGHQHFPIIAGGDQRVELRPGVGLRGASAGRAAVCTSTSDFGDDRAIEYVCREHRSDGRCCPDNRDI